MGRAQRRLLAVPAKPQAVPHPNSTLGLTGVGWEGRAVPQMWEMVSPGVFLSQEVSRAPLCSVLGSVPLSPSTGSSGRCPSPGTMASSGVPSRHSY